jgi:ectoine hydroxylase-related dioxygenase (phytanoyl-CoA dioxygenase family)
MLQNAPLNQPNNAHQGYSWHRDLVWQHFVSTRPISLTVTYALDDYTEENGGFEVISSSHLFSKFPSHSFAESNAERITFKAGSIIFDSMVFHRAGINKSTEARNLLVQLYSIPLLKQQICIPTMLGNIDLNDEEKMILGYGTDSAKSVLNWRERRLSRI